MKSLGGGCDAHSWANVGDFSVFLDSLSDPNIWKGSQTLMSGLGDMITKWLRPFKT